MEKLTQAPATAYRHILTGLQEEMSQSSEEFWFNRFYHANSYAHTRLMPAVSDQERARCEGVDDYLVARMSTALLIGIAFEAEITRAYEATDPEGYHAHPLAKVYRQEQKFSNVVVEQAERAEKETLEQARRRADKHLRKIAKVVRKLLNQPDKGQFVPDAPRVADCCTSCLDEEDMQALQQIIYRPKPLAADDDNDLGF